MAPASSLVLMLEDDADRIQSFKRLLATHYPAIQLRYWRDAAAFIEAFPPEDDVPILILLDHDLIADAVGGPDPGDGRMVARFLATQEPCCPVIVHSTNSPASESMRLTLTDAGWQVHRVMPMGDDWIELLWWPLARNWLDP